MKVTKSKNSAMRAKAVKKLMKASHKKREKAC